MKLKRVYVEIINTCNLKCPFCPPLKRKPAVMSVSDFEAVAKEVRRVTEYIYLHVKGEPFMHPDFERILQICAELGLRVTLTTNGTLLAVRGDTLLANSGAIRQLNISVHAAAYFTPAEREEYIENLLAFVKKAEGFKGYIVLRLWGGKDGRTLDETNSYIYSRLCNEYNKEYNLNQGGQLPRNTTLASRLIINIEEEFAWPRAEDACEGVARGSCRGMRDMAAVLCDGTVVPCCLDDGGEINLGNCFKTPLSEIIESERAQAIKRGFENRRITEPFCIGCKYRHRFDK